MKRQHSTSSPGTPGRTGGRHDKRAKGTGEPAGRSGLVVATHGRHLVVEPAEGPRLICHPGAKIRGRGG